MLEPEKLVDFLLGIDGVSLEFNSDKTQLCVHSGETCILEFDLSDKAIEFMTGSFDEVGSHETLKRLFVKGIRGDFSTRLAMHRLYIDVTKSRPVYNTTTTNLAGTLAFNADTAMFVIAFLEEVEGSTVHSFHHKEMTRFLNDHGYALG